MTTASKLQAIHIAMIGLCLASHVAASDSTFTKDEIYAPLVNAYESDLLDKRAVLEKCVTTACKVHTQLDVTRLSSKLTEIKAIYAHIAPEKALVQSLSNEIYAAKEGK